MFSLQLYVRMQMSVSAKHLQYKPHLCCFAVQEQLQSHPSAQTDSSGRSRPESKASGTNRLIMASKPFNAVRGEKKAPLHSQSIYFSVSYSPACLLTH